MTTEVIHQLTEREARKLVAEINADAEDLGSKLIRLCREMGWAALGYTSFRECCKAEFANHSWALGKSPSWVCRQIKYIETKAGLPIGNDHLPESVVRELNKLPADQRADAWQDITERLGDHPTAEQVAHEVYMMRPDGDPPESPATRQDASYEEEAHEDEAEEEDTGDGEVANEDGEGDALLDVLCDFHDKEWPDMSWAVFAARVENTADRIRSLV